MIRNVTHVRVREEMVKIALTETVENLLELIQGPDGKLNPD